MKRELFVGIGIGAAAVALLAGVPANALLFGVLILACPLMMLFMHGGHGGKSGHAGHDNHSAGISPDDPVGTALLAPVPQRKR